MTTIITNHVPRLMIDAYELTAVERKEFDYIDWDRVDEGEISGSFVRYKGWIYDLGDMMPAPIDGWDAIVNETFFSGALFRYAPNDNDRVICGRYYE